jgi:hypothetical protein
MKKVELDGEFKLFDTPILQLRGKLSGRIDTAGDLKLSGKIENKGSLGIGDASAIITNNQIQVILHVLGAELALDAALVEKNLQLHGRTAFNIQLPKISIGPFKVPGPRGDISLGSFTLDCAMNGSIDLTLGVGIFRAEIQGGFHFNSMDWHMPTLVIEVSPSSLDDLLDNIVNFIKANAKKIFKQLIDNCEVWLKFVNEKIMQGVEKVSEILSEVYHLEVDEIKELLKKFPDICISESLHANFSLPHVDGPSIHTNVPPKHANTPKHINHGNHADKCIHADTPHVNKHVNT